MPIASTVFVTSGVKWERGHCDEQVSKIPENWRACLSTSPVSWISTHVETWLGHTSAKGCQCSWLPLPHCVHHPHLTVQAHWPVDGKSKTRCSHALCKSRNLDMRAYVRGRRENALWWLSNWGLNEETQEERSRYVKENQGGEEKKKLSVEDGASR